METNKKLVTLANTINKLCREYGDDEVAGLLGYLYGTIHKGYDEEEQRDCIIEDCLRLQKDSKYYLDK